MAASPYWPARDADHLLVSAAQMAAIEDELFASGLPVEALMEKAALGLSRRILLLEPQRPVVVLVGPGHNGGDGLVVARELFLAGRNVCIWCPFDRLKPLTASHFQHARWLGVPVLDAPPDPEAGSLWVDGLFGNGQRRPPGPEMEALLQRRHRHQPDGLVSIDVPTGLCSDTGTWLGDFCAHAQITYCLGLIRQGLVQDPALASVGLLERIDLGLPPSLLVLLAADQPLGLGLSPQAMEADLIGAPWPLLDPAAAKYGRGRLLVVAGSRRYQGAVHLALMGATAAGCGSLRAMLPQEVASQLWLAHPHVVVEAALPSLPDGSLCIAPRDLPGAWLDRLDALLIGPGLGCGPEPSAPWPQLQDFPGLVVIDADGLNRLARSNAPLDWFTGRRGATWITPHRQEFGRLFPDLVALPSLEAAAQAARRSNAVVLLKGARTVVAAPDGRRWQILRANQKVARSGLGDLLAGYGAGIGAMAVASTSTTPDAALLAAAALSHARAGCQLLGTSPMDMAVALQSVADLSGNIW
ncbi:MAG: NAD(P)H-hydrate dehydratase [Cyanobacteriota bacterium]